MKTFLGLFSTAVALVGAVSAHAQSNYGSKDGLRLQSRQALDVRDPQRDWRTFRNYDVGRVEEGQRRYEPTRYYRDSRYYQERALGLGDRLYRENTQRFYCRRPDGTVGVVSGEAGLGVGNFIGHWDAKPIGALINGSERGRLARAVDRGRLICH
jgi:hypothetical protein